MKTYELVKKVKVSGKVTVGKHYDLVKEAPPTIKDDEGKEVSIWQTNKDGGCIPSNWKRIK